MKAEELLSRQEDIRFEASERMKPLLEAMTIMAKDTGGKEVVLAAVERRPGRPGAVGLRIMPRTPELGMDDIFLSPGAALAFAKRLIRLFDEPAVPQDVPDAEPVAVPSETTKQAAAANPSRKRGGK